MSIISPKSHVADAITFYQELSKGRYRQLESQKLTGDCALHFEVATKHIKLIGNVLEADRLEKGGVELRHKKTSSFLIALGYIAFIFVLPLYWARLSLIQNNKLEAHASELEKLAVDVSVVAAHSALQRLALLNGKTQLTLEGRVKVDAHAHAQLHQQLDHLQRLQGAANRAIEKLHQTRLRYGDGSLPSSLDPEELAVLAVAAKLTDRVAKAIALFGAESLSSPVESKPWIPSHATEMAALTLSTLESTWDQDKEKLELESLDQALALRRLQAKKVAEAKSSQATSVGTVVDPTSITFGSFFSYLATRGAGLLGSVADAIAPEKPPLFSTAVAGRFVVGDYGIEQAGNTCFLASALQFIRFNPELRALIFREIPSMEFVENQAPLLLANRVKILELQGQLRAIVLWLERGAKVPSAQIKQLALLMRSMGANFIKPSMWGGFEQADGPEAVNWLLETLLINTQSVPSHAGRVAASSLLLQLNQEKMLAEEGCSFEKSGLAFPLRVAGRVTPESILNLETHYQAHASGYVIDYDHSDPRHTLQQLHSGLLPTGDRYRIEYNDFSTVAKELRTRVTLPFTQPQPYINPLVVERKVAGNTQTFLAGRLYDKVSFQNTPPLLMLSLKRFHHDAAGVRSKVTGAVQLPLQLDIAPYLAANAQVTGSTQYEIHSIIQHQGDFGGGHYVTYQKQLTGHWIECNDATVRELVDFDPSKLDGSYLISYRQMPVAP